MPTPLSLSPPDPPGGTGPPLSRAAITRAPGSRRLGSLECGGRSLRNRPGPVRDEALLVSSLCGSDPPVDEPPRVVGRAGEGGSTRDGSGSTRSHATVTQGIRGGHRTATRAERARKRGEGRTRACPLVLPAGRRHPVVLCVRAQPAARSPPRFEFFPVCSCGARPLFPSPVGGASTLAFVAAEAYPRVRLVPPRCARKPIGSTLRLPPRPERVSRASGHAPTPALDPFLEHFLSPFSSAFSSAFRAVFKWHWRRKGWDPCLDQRARAGSARPPVSRELARSGSESFRCGVEEKERKMKFVTAGRLRLLTSESRFSNGGFPVGTE